MLRRLIPGFASSAPLRPTAHRRIAKRDVEHMRWAGDGGWVMPMDNPGVRVEPEFVTAEEAYAISAELDQAASETRMNAITSESIVRR